MRPIQSLSHKLVISYVIAFAFVAAVNFFLRSGNWFSGTTIFWIELGVLVFILAALHYYFRRMILVPIRHLIHVTKQLTQNNNSKERAKRFYNDELGDLVHSLNELIDEIQLREDLLVSERDRTALAHEQANSYATEMRATNHKLEFQVQVRKRIESKLTQFQNFLTNIIDSMPSALITIDEDLMVTQWNAEATKLTHNSVVEAIGKKITEAFPQLEPYENWVQLSLDLQSTQTINAIDMVANHQKRFFDITIYPLQQQSNKEAVIRIDDVTDKMRMEEAMVQSEKVMSLGGMAAGMAHEINNPISAIVQNAQNITRRLDPALKANQAVADEFELDLHQLQQYLKKRKILAFLNHITESGIRASNLVTNMLQFSRSSDVMMQPCLLTDVLEKAINIALTDDKLHTIKDKFEMNIDQDFEAHTATTLGVFTELEQVVLNLIKNAAYAISARKNTLNDIDEGIIRIELTADAQFATIKVSDNGIGMTPETKKRVFEPFFTTKGVGEGTGLGLSVSYFIIENHHNGRMAVDSSFGHGTTFEIKLPLAR